MHYTEYHDSEYLAGEDLYKGPVTVTIEKAYGKEENLGDGKKLYHVLEFKEIELKLILNITNARSIAEIIGDGDDKSWAGNQIELYPKMQTSFGITKPAVRIRQAASTSILDSIQNAKSLEDVKTIYAGLDQKDKKHRTILDAIKKRKEDLS